MAERVTANVCVIGAGYAGVTAARELMRRGKDVYVLEARDRVGGRIWSVERRGHRVDIGGAWIGPAQSEAARWRASSMLRCIRRTQRASNVLFIDNEVKRFRGTVPRLSPIALASLALGMARLDLMAKRVPLEAPWEAKRARAWDAQSAGAWIARNMPPGAGREMLDAGVRGLMTCDPSEVSLLHLLLLMRSAGGLNPLLSVEGGYQQDLVVGGAATMAERVADELGDRIRLLSPVREIAQSDRGVRVVADEIEVEADYAIVATPPALADRISFTPALPPDRAQLLERMLTGSIIKFVVMYHDAFWRTEGLAGLTVRIGRADRDDDRRGSARRRARCDRRVRVRSARVEDVGVVGRRPAQDRARRLGRGVRRRTDRRPSSSSPRTGPPNRGRAAARWPTFHPGRSRSSAERCAEPCGRIHWAGTETATVSHGTFDGAIRSGKRAAAEVLGRG